MSNHMLRGIIKIINQILFITRLDDKQGKTIQLLVPQIKSITDFNAILAITISVFLWF